MHGPTASQPVGAPMDGDAELMTLVEALRGRGVEDLAMRLEAARVRIVAESEAMRQHLSQGLSVTHEINNALVGVAGNAQLLAMGPAAGLPAVRDRLDVIQREAERIRKAALRLGDLKRELRERNRAGEGGG